MAQRSLWIVSILPPAAWRSEGKGLHVATDDLYQASQCSVASWQCSSAGLSTGKRTVAVVSSWSAAASRSVADAEHAWSLQMATTESHSTPMPSHEMDRNRDTCRKPALLYTGRAQTRCGNGQCTCHSAAVSVDRYKQRFAFQYGVELQDYPSETQHLLAVAQQTAALAGQRLSNSHKEREKEPRHTCM
jgi:hypothetical protein